MARSCVFLAGGRGIADPQSQRTLLGSAGDLARPATAGVCGPEQRLHDRRGRRRRRPAVSRRGVGGRAAAPIAFAAGIRQRLGGQIEWYDTAHDVLDIAAIGDRARSLAVQLKLEPIEPILKAKIAAR